MVQQPTGPAVAAGQIVTATFDLGNSSAVRKHNRCQLTGRPKGYIRLFGISRNVFRNMALEGKIPGVTKSSW